MNLSPARKAIKEALDENWKEALSLNKEILKTDPKNINALTRVSKAFFELGRLDEARASAKKALRIDPQNQIAQKSYNKYKSLSPEDITTVTRSTLPNIKKINLFLEEPGKTKIVDLKHLTDSKFLATLDCGDEVQIVPSNFKVTCTDNEGKYVGRIPDDVATKIIDESKNGVEFRAHIKSINSTEVKIFVRNLTA